MGVDRAAGRLVELSKRERREQLIAARALLLGDRNGGLQGFLRRDGSRRIEVEQEFAARPADFASEHAVACAVAGRQSFVENSQCAFRIADARLGLGQRDLDNPVEHYSVLPTDALDAPAHSLDSFDERSATSCHPPGKELADRVEEREFVIAHDLCKFGDTRPRLRAVATH